MKPQSCKNKGRTLQKLIVKDLLEQFPFLTEDDVRSTSMGCSGEDIQMSNAARSVIPFSFEAKNQERVNIWASLEQAKANTPAGIDYAVVFKKNNAQPHVTVSWKTFLKLINPQNENRVHVSELHKIATALNEIASQIK